MNKYVFALIWSLPVVALFYLCIGAVWPFHTISMFRTLGLCLGFVAIASFTYRRLPIIGVAALTGIVSFIFGFIPWFRFIYWVAVAIFALIEMANLYRNFSKQYLVPVLSAALVLIGVLCPYFSLQYSEPFNELRLVQSNLHSDTLYHAAVASMLKIHHVVSHGLHGVGRLDYHFGSHILMACVSKLSGLSVFESYGYFYVFFFVPFFGVMVLSVAEEFLPSAKGLDFWGKLLAYLIIMLGTGILAPGSLLYRFALLPNFFESESFAVSLILLLSMVSILHAKSSILALWPRTLLICGVFALTTITKISTGFCTLYVLGSWALLSGERCWSKRWFFKWGVFLFCVIVFCALRKVVNPGMTEAAIQPFQFLQDYVKFSGPFWLKLILFLCVHCAFPVSALLLYLVMLSGGGTQKYFPAWWALGTLVSMMIGMAMLLLMYITGGAASYFADISIVMGFPVLACFPQAGRTLLAESTGDTRFPPRVVLAVYRLLVALAVLGFCFYAPRAIIAGARTFLEAMKQRPPATTLASYVEKLHTIRNDPTSLNAVVYIPRTEKAYWNSMFCRGAGLFIPAISERPALYAWPTNECFDFLCGPRFYSNGLCEKSQKAFTDEQLLLEAKNIGFERVDIVTSKGIRNLR